MRITITVSAPAEERGGAFFHVARAIGSFSAALMGLQLRKVIDRDDGYSLMVRWTDEPEEKR